VILMMKKKRNELVVHCLLIYRIRDENKRMKGEEKEREKKK
jgi:hypothetical protein